MSLQAEFIGQFNDTLEIDGFKLFVEPKYVQENKNKDIYIQFSNGFALAKSYASRYTSTPVRIRRKRKRQLAIPRSLSILSYQL